MLHTKRDVGGVKEAKGCGGPQRPATVGRLTTPGSERVKRGLEPCEEPATARETAGTQWQEHLPVSPWGLPDPARTRGQGAPPLRAQRTKDRPGVREKEMGLGIG